MNNINISMLKLTMNLLWMVVSSTVVTTNLPEGNQSDTQISLYFCVYLSVYSLFT